MAGIPKISKMLKYPELLKYKKESEDHDERRRKKREDGWEKYSDMIKDQVSISGTETEPSHTPAPERPAPPPPVPKKDKKKITVGKNIDLFV